MLKGTMSCKRPGSRSHALHSMLVCQANRLLLTFIHHAKGARP